MLLRRPFSVETVRVAIGGREVGGGGSSVEISKIGLASLLGVPVLHNFHTGSGRLRPTGRENAPLRPPHRPRPRVVLPQVDLREGRNS